MKMVPSRRLWRSTNRQKHKFFIINNMNRFIWRYINYMFIIFFIALDIMNDSFKWLFTKWTFCFYLKFQRASKSTEPETSGIFKTSLTFDHSNRHLKQNWCIQESEKHLFEKEPKQMAQLGGGLLAEFGLFITLLSAMILL